MTTRLYVHLLYNNSFVFATREHEGLWGMKKFWREHFKSMRVPVEACTYKTSLINLVPKQVLGK